MGRINIKGGSNGVAPFQMDDHYADINEPGRHIHDEHEASISKVIGLEQRNKGRTDMNAYADKPPMTGPGNFTSEKPQPSSRDAAASKSRP